MGVMARAARREQGFVYIERGMGSVKQEVFPKISTHSKKKLLPLSKKVCT